MWRALKDNVALLCKEVTEHVFYKVRTFPFLDTELQRELQRRA